MRGILELPSPSAPKLRSPAIKFTNQETCILCDSFFSKCENSKVARIPPSPRLVVEGSDEDATLTVQRKIRFFFRELKFKSEYRVKPSKWLDTYVAQQKNSHGMRFFFVVQKIP